MYLNANLPQISQIHRIYFLKSNCSIEYNQIFAGLTRARVDEKLAVKHQKKHDQISFL